jgi:glycosyltransferase involved in cell wall biosynthesis
MCSTLLPVGAHARFGAESAGRDIAPVRVCFLIDELAAAGTEKQLIALLSRLDRTRVEPILCLLRGHSAASRALEPDGCRIVRLGVKSLRRPASLRRALWFARFLRKSRIEVLQAFFPDSCYFGLPAAWLAGVPHRVRTRNNLGHWLTPLHRWLGRLLNFVSTVNVANCRAAADALHASERPPQDSIVVLENGVDLERFQNIAPLEMQLAGEAVHIGALANLRPVKGLALLVEAASRLSAEHPTALFEVAGEGEQRPELERLIDRQRLQGRFHLAGAVSDASDFLARQHIAVLCSHSEGMSNALLEYMAAGRAVVATAVGAAPDIITDEVHGLLVPAGDPGALAQAIGRLLHEPELAMRLGREARNKACGRYSREAMVRRFEDFYEGLARRGAENGGLHIAS